ncbi:MAG: ribosome biogenesis GTPase Der [Myxococcota bacterium]
MTRLPLIALVGRPNVGKSTLFNRMVGRRMALVDNQPGVTRDRLFGDMRFDGRLARLVDTGGLDFDTDDTVMSHVREQSQLAIDEADLIVLVVDAAAGVMPADRDVAELLRRSGKPVVVAANKIDEHMHESRVAEMYELGIEHVFPVSGEHGYRYGELGEWLMDTVEAPEQEAWEDTMGPIPVDALDLPDSGTSRIEWKGGPIRVAVVGRPNAGKSTLINALLGEERLVATEVPGTTMDSVDTELEREGQSFLFVDTAGIRRKRSVAHKLEKFAVMAAVRGMERADVVLLLLDGTQRPSDQDAKIAALAHDRGKGLVIVASKWDLIENPEWRDNYEAAIRHDMPWISYAKVLRVSGKTSKNTHRIYSAVVDAQRERHRRVGTGELNRFFRDVIEHHPPPIRNGRRARLLFGSQPLLRPPTFIFTTNRAPSIPGSYKRYLENRLRERYGFHGTPIWIKFREKKNNKRKQDR